MRKLHQIALVLLLVALAAVSSHAEDVVEHDRSRISIFVQPSVSFLNFEEREYFQNAIDTIYHSFREDAVTESDSLNVAKQDFQKVNFCFPVTAGLQFQIFQDHFISAGIGFIYDNESVVLTDRKSRTHNYSYTIQGVPLFLEYRIGIPKNLMTLSGESLFSFSLRWYWVLPGTEIYTTWGKIEAETPVSGAGFGLGIGYLIASWKNFNVYGDIGFSSISVKSKKPYAKIVPDGPKEKAEWNIGGLQMQVRVSFGLWNEQAPADDAEKAEKHEGGKTDPALIVEEPVAGLKEEPKADLEAVSSKTEPKAEPVTEKSEPAAEKSEDEPKAEPVPDQPKATEVSPAPAGK